MEMISRNNGDCGILTLGGKFIIDFDGNENCIDIGIFRISKG